MVKAEKIVELSKALPIGSKVRLIGLSICSAKVIGYHERGRHVLVYNPELEGHCGNDAAYTEYLTLLSNEYLKGKYGPHMYYFPANWMQLLKKSTWAIYEEGLGHD